MTDDVRNPTFAQVLAEALALCEAKNQDYASDDDVYSNFEFTASAAGVPVDTVFAVLDGVKTARLRELTTSGREPKFESIEDTIMDKIVYAGLRLAYRRDHGDGTP